MQERNLLMRFVYPVCRLGLLASLLIGAYVPSTASSQALSPTGRQFFVSPDGKSSGDGSMERPWDLATALAGPGAVQPGDTIWLRGGTYRGGFRSSLSGRKGAPIIVRQYPGERAVIDGKGFSGKGFSGFALDIAGSWTWYW